MRIRSDPSVDPTDYDFAHRLRIRFAETDAMAIVHHSRYLPLMEEARVAYLRHLGHPYSSIRDAGVDMAVLEISVQYRKALRFDDIVDVHVVLTSVQRATFQMNYLLAVDGVAHAVGSTSHGAITSEGKATRLPAWLRDLAGSTT